MARTNRHKKRYVPRYQFDALLVMFVTLLLLVLVIILTPIVMAKGEFASPLNDNVVFVERHHTRVVEKPVFEVPQSPKEIICAVFTDNCEEALRVANCESGLNPTAANKTSSARGLFQVMQSWHKIDQKWLFHPYINTLVAKKLYDESGGSFSPHWNASRHCWGK